MTYETNDLALAAFLRYQNFEMSEVTDDGKGRKKFIFYSNNDLTQMVEDFRRGAALVSPEKYYNEIRMLKSHFRNN